MIQKEILEDKIEQYLIAWAFGVIRSLNVLGASMPDLLGSFLSDLFLACDSNEVAFIKKAARETGILVVREKVLEA